MLLYNSGMSISRDVTMSESRTSPQNELSDKERRQRWFEVCLVILVAFGGHVLSALYYQIQGPNALPQASSSKFAGSIMQEITALLLLGYILSRRGLRFSSLGLRWSLTDLGMGLFVTAFSYAAYGAGYMLVQTVHHLVYGSWADSPTTLDFFMHPSVLAIPLAVLNPFFEELIVRAYLMTEVVELTGSSTLAVALSVFVQFSYHLYYGWGGAISVAFFFLALALYYARSRRVLPVIVAHGLSDVYALIRLWW
jgi:membrane protease YdiL (CAAX protease family)